MKTCVYYEEETVSADDARLARALAGGHVGEATPANTIWAQDVPGPQPERELSNLIMKVAEADPKLVEYRDAEMLTTRIKKVDNTKAVRDLGHADTVTLEEGVQRTVAWMRKVYDLKTGDRIHG